MAIRSKSKKKSFRSTLVKPLIIITSLLLLFVLTLFFIKDTEYFSQVKRLFIKNNVIEPKLDYEKPEIINSSQFPTYYFADEKGIWFKDGYSAELELIFSSKKNLKKELYPSYKFQIINRNIVIVMYSVPYDDTEMYECDRTSGKHICTSIDKTYTFGEEKPLIRKIPSENAYVFLRKIPEKLSWFGEVYAQTPYNVEVVKRDYEKGNTEVITQIVQEIGCGGGSWHNGYYHGHKRSMTITSNKLILLQLGCEGYPGETSQYVVDINKKEIIPGEWNFITPKEINGNRILFHRVEKIPTQSGKPQQSEHVFYTALLQDLTKETKVKNMGPNKYVSDFVYHKDRKQIYVSYIQNESPYGANLGNDFDLRIAELDLQNAKIRDIYNTTAFYIPNLLLDGDMLIFTTEFSTENYLEEDYYTHIFDLSTNKIIGTVDKKVTPLVYADYVQ